jgi:hypothetical protein
MCMICSFGKDYVSPIQLTSKLITVLMEKPEMSQSCQNAAVKENRQMHAR